MAAKFKQGEGPNSEDVYVVRLSGDATGASTARLEGSGFVAGDVGNTFTLGGTGVFPEYTSYAAAWMGDTVQDAELRWNGVSYLAGAGSGSAGYQHALLPFLRGDEGVLHDAEIVLTAQPGAFVEFRFTVEAG